MRAIKTGLAAMAVLAFTVIPSIASASGGIASESYPATLSGATNGEFIFEGHAGALGCESVPLAGQLHTVAPSATLAVGDGVECYTGPMKANGCKFTVNMGTEPNATVDIGGQGCAGITMNLYGITETILPQSGLKATLKTEGGKLKLHTEAANVIHEVGGKTYTNGVLNDTWTISGTGGNLETASYLSPVGFYIEGATPEFHLAEYASPDGSEVSESFGFATKVGSIECEANTYDGTSYNLGGAWLASSTLDLDADYNECIMGGALPVTTAMNSCHYAYHVSNSAPPYTGTVDVACSKLGDAIDHTFKSASGATCHVKIPAQSGLTGVSFTNQGSGSSRQVKITSNVKGIQYSISECSVGNGTYANGSETGSIAVGGLG